jgi:hypothetical protein
MLRLLQPATLRDGKPRGRLGRRPASRFGKLPLFEIARVLVRLDHFASFIVNANHGIV